MIGEARRPRGLTLIELLVVVSIVGLLVAITLPALQSSRESARRARCASNLKQFGVALAGHLGAHRVYPSGLIADGRLRDGRLFAFPSPFSIHVQLLPYLDQSAVFASINLATDVVFRGDAPPSAENPKNATSLATALEVFLCPSDGSELAWGTNYRGTTGPNPALHDGTPWPGGGGAFPGLVATSDRAITDGLSQTIGFSERLRGSGRGRRFDRARDVWFTGLSQMQTVPDAAGMAAACAGLTAADPPAWTRSGQTWIVGGYLDTLYNHVAPPNWASADCSANDGGSGDSAISTAGATSARSAHPGGVHALFLDGSVRFVRQGLSTDIWKALSTRDGRDPVDATAL